MSVLKAIPAVSALVALTIFAAVPAAAQATHVGTPPGVKERSATEAYSKLPITFVENRGQTHGRVRYFARGPHYAFFLTSNEVVLSLAKKSRGPALENTAAQSLPDGVALGLRFLGANPKVP